MMNQRTLWLHFCRNNPGSWGGGLNDPFGRMDIILRDRFQAASIEFPYGEIEICLAFPSSEAEESQQRKEWFAKLPIYYRGKTMVRVILPMPGDEETLTDVFQIIHKAFDIIISKRKKTDGYDPEKLKSTLVQLENELQNCDMWEVDREYTILCRKESIEKRMQEREIRKQENIEKKRLIYDVRFMHHFPGTERDNLFFSPYDYLLCGMILEKLREKKFRLPNYTHLYIQVSDTFENALQRAVRAENWFVYGIAVLEDHADFPTKSDAEKRRIVFDLIRQGLNDIANIDKLDAKTLNDVLDEVEQDLCKK